MRKIFTFLFIALFVSTLSAQEPEAVIMKASVAPVVGGEIDEVWDEAEKNMVDKAFREEAATIGEEGETWWKMLWSDEGLYVLVNVTDDDWYPWYEASGSNGWQYDKPELYFDANYVLDDQLGGQNPGNSGNYQIAPDPTADNTNGEAFEDFNAGTGIQYAWLVDDPNYVVEYFVPFTYLLDKDGAPVDIAGEIGFDVTVIDNDAPGGDDGRQRAVWSNIGTADESWNNMDEAGSITLDGAEVIYVDEINLTVDGNITEDNQTIQVMAEVLPEDATVKAVKWTLTSKDGSRVRAKISSDGVITPVTDEELIIVARSSDDFTYSNEVEVSITGQVVTMEEVNYIKNGNFDVVKEDGAPGDPWTGGSTVIDGVLNITNTNGQGVNPWDWTVGQNVQIPEELKDEPFILKLKMGISNADTVDVDFELIGDDYLRFGNTTDPKSSDGRSQWRWAPLEATPMMYEIAIDNFSGMDTRQQKFNLFCGLTNETVYVDSVYLVAVSDLDLIGTGVARTTVETFDVYPNPATNQLNVRLQSPNTRVMIYNSVGIKMEETVVVGTHHVFDVSDYTPGMYFVKANNAVMKFMK